MIDYLTKLSTFSDEIALCFEHESYTYFELNRKINYFYDELSEVKSGQVVCIISDYSFEAISLFFALTKNKNVIVPIVSDNKEEIDKRLLVTSPDYVVNLRENNKVEIKNYCIESKERHPLITNIVKHDNAGLILFSSGSTGQPKAMVHDLDSLLSTYVGRREKTLSIMVFLMFDHIGGLNTLLSSLSMGAKVVIPTKRESEHVAMLIEREKVNILPASPTFLNMMLIANTHLNYNLKSLRMVTYGTESMPESLLERLKSAFPRVKLLQTFGTSETGIVKTSSRSSSSLEIRIDDSDQEYKIVDNELWLRSKTQILGYLNYDMESFSDDGWFRTGDLVEQYEDGYLKIVGRTKEVINVGGEKVLPSEVESVILELNEVNDCTVYSVSNPITGQSVAVKVSVDDNVDVKELKRKIRIYCKKNLEGYKVPTKYDFLMCIEVSDRFKKVRSLK